MNSSSQSRLKKNKTLDLGAWILVILIILGIPLLVSLTRTPPELGPVGDPSIFIMFMTFLVLISLGAMALIGTMVMGRSKSLADPNGLTPLALNTANVLSKLIGGLFLISGFVKLQDTIGFGYKLDDYWVVFQEYLSFFPTEFMKTLSVPFAGFVSVFEIAIAFALMTGYRMRQTSLLMLLMIIFFTFLTGFSSITGKVTDCGCFGDALKLTPTESFIKDLFLTAAIIPIFMLRKRMHPYYRSPIPVSLTVLSTLFAGIISFYTFQHLPLMDFRGAYTPGQDLEYNRNTIDPHEGQPIAHDFTDFCQPCKKNGFEGATLYIIMYNMDKASKESLEAAGALEAELSIKAPGIKVCAGTNTLSRTRREMDLPFREGFCLDGYQDGKVLKTIVRSSPGYVFLKDGIVQKKWHLNDIPTVEELRELAGSFADQKPPEPAPLPSIVPDSLEIDSLSEDSTAQPN